MITGFVGQGRFHSIDKWGFILFSKNSPDDLKVFVGRQKEKFLWEGKDTPPPPPLLSVICYLLSNELIMYIGLY